jgi:choline-sulfatase
MQWQDEQVTAACQDWLRERSQEGGDARPFAAVCGFFFPHCPFVCERELFEHYHDRVEVPSIEADQTPTITRFRRHREVLDLSDEAIRGARAAYYGMVEWFDRQVGRILTTLEESGLAENTLVLYCSDHGEMAGEHGCWWKSSYYEGSAGVPVIARLPKVVPAGTVCDAVCNLVDLGVTFADLAGAPALRQSAGRSLWPTLQGRHPSDWVDETFSEFCEAKYTGATHYPSRMIRSGPWKLWWYGDDEKLPPALFHLGDDPEERRDLGRDPAHAEIRERLLARLRQGWDHHRVRERSLELSADMKILQRWASTLRPEAPGLALFPLPDGYDDDVVLLSGKRASV